jgi:predicted DNA-binding transcriptional regulator YafY
MTQRANRYQSLDRTVQVLAALMQGQELDREAVARLGNVKLPTADRQIRALAKCPGVTQDRKGHKKVLRFDPKGMTPPPTFPEVIAVCLGSSLSRIFEGSSYERTMKSALDYVLSRTRRQAAFKDIERKLLFVARGGEVAFPDRSADLDDLVGAVLHSQPVTIDYTRFEGDSETLRIEPLYIAIYDHQLYIIAATPRGPHPYRFARIARVDAHDDESFTYPTRAEYDPDQVFRDSIGIFISDTYPVQDVVIRLAPRWAHYARSHRWHKSERLKLNKDGSGTLSLRVKTCPELDMWVLGLGEHAEVLKPADVRERIARRIQAVARNTMRTGN